MEFKIGNINIKNQIVLAPMAGITNASFISIASNMGVGLAYTEMISAEAIVRGNKKTLNMLKGIDKLDIPIAIQLFGNSPKTMVNAAKYINLKYPKAIIDINMGCPVPKVSLRSKSGAALLKDPKKVKEIVSSIVKETTCPVTVKIRSGWDKNSINAKEIAKIIEKAKASAITIHPRTRSEGYSGNADWNIIKEVKEVVSIPVIGNGDIKSPLDAKRMLDETKCDAIMIGRGVLGNPFLIKQIIDFLSTGLYVKEVSKEEKIDMIKKHLDELLKIKEEKEAILEMRSHIAWYLKGLKNSSKVKNEIFKTKNKKEIINILDEYLKGDYYEC